MSEPARHSDGPQAILRATEAAARGRRPRGPGAGITAVGAEVPEAVRKALAYVLRITGQRPQTEAELRAKLRRRDVPDDVADEALTRARALRAVDDAALASSWVAERGLDKGYGAGRLRTELRRRLVPEPLIDEALAQLEARDDTAAATDLARRRLRQLPGSLPPEAVVRRLTAYLVRRGHPPALAQRVAISVSGIDRDWD